MSVLLLHGNALALPLQDASIHCVVTSPPYWSLRDYGIAGQLGQEDTPETYVAALVAVFREVWRVLRNDGTLWLNLGDSYANDNKWGGSTGGKHAKALHGEPVGRGKRQTALAPKNLVGIPWRVAFALQADGWILRSEIIWHKPNVMPESVADRPTKAHEQVFLLTKQAGYYYDGAAIKEAQAASMLQRHDPRVIGPKMLQRDAGSAEYSKPCRILPDGRNARSVWTIPTQPYAGAHFATFPQALAAKCILAGTSAAGCCPQCGTDWVRQVTRDTGEVASYNGSSFQRGKTHDARTPLAPVGQGPRTMAVHTLGFAPACACDAGPPVPCRVLDPCVGSGTVPLVARALGRQGIGLDLSWPYLQLARERLGLTALAQWEGEQTRNAAPVGYDDLPLFQ